LKQKKKAKHVPTATETKVERSHRDVVSEISPRIEMDQMQFALKSLVEKSPSITLASDEKQKPAVPFSPCNPPDITPPQFTVPFRQPIMLFNLLIPGRFDPDPQGIIPPIPDFYLACVKVTRPGPPPPDLASYPIVPMVEFKFAIDLKFEQSWNMIKLGIGDLSSTMSLAPLEKLTLEFLTSQRKLFEKETLDSVEEITKK